MNIEVTRVARHRRTVFLPSGKGDFGEITEEMAAAVSRKAGPIRLLQGFQAPNGKGFGLAHIEANMPRGRQLEGLGFRDATHFVSHIASNFTSIAKDVERLVLLLEHKGGVWLHLVLEWDEDGFWSCTTAIPKRQRRDKVDLWSKPRSDESEPASESVGNRRRFETLSLPKKPTGKES